MVSALYLQIFCLQFPLAEDWSVCYNSGTAETLNVVSGAVRPRSPHEWLNCERQSPPLIN